MLRHYDEIGLLAPKSTDSFTGYRYYGEDQLPVAGQINALKDMGFGLSAIGEILKGYGDPQRMAEFLSVKRAEVKAESEDPARRLRLRETAIERLRKDGTAMNYHVSLKTLPERYVASVRQILPTYGQEHLLWKTLMEETSALRLQADEPCYCSAIFHDGEYKESDVDVEAQKTVRGHYADTGHVKFKTVPPVTFASATYKGPYEIIGEVNMAVASWARDNGYEFDGPAFNIYHVSPHETPNPEEFVTEVCYPVRRQ
jgi:DNA-binding transcriptional MerR regulator